MSRTVRSFIDMNKKEGDNSEKEYNTALEDPEKHFKTEDGDEQTNIKYSNGQVVKYGDKVYNMQSDSGNGDKDENGNLYEWKVIAITGLGDVMVEEKTKKTDSGEGRSIMLDPNNSKELVPVLDKTTPTQSSKSVEPKRSFFSRFRMSGINKSGGRRRKSLKKRGSRKTKRSRKTRKSRKSRRKMTKRRRR